MFWKFPEKFRKFPEKIWIFPEISKTIWKFPEQIRKFPAKFWNFPEICWIFLEISGIFLKFPEMSRNFRKSAISVDPGEKHKEKQVRTETTYININFLGVLQEDLDQNLSEWSSGDSLVFFPGICEEKQWTLRKNARRKFENKWKKQFNPMNQLKKNSLGNHWKSGIPTFPAVIIQILAWGIRFSGQNLANLASRGEHIGFIFFENIRTHRKHIISFLFFFAEI